MIDQTLIDKNEKLLTNIAEGKINAENACDELVSQLNDTDSNYTSLIEQNAELYKEMAKYKAQLKSLIQCSDSNTGHEPSLSVFQREIDISKGLIGYGDNEL